jgi:spermidine/putrescine transport system permease protein
MKTKRVIFSFSTVAVSSVALWLVLFVLLPALLIFLASFLHRDTENFLQLPFSIESYRRLLEPEYWPIVLDSLVLAAWTTACSLLLGLPVAYALVVLPVRWRQVGLFLLILPFWTNSLIRIYAIKMLLGNKGLFNVIFLTLGLVDEPVQLLYTPFAIVFGSVYVLLPFMIMPIYSSVEKMDGRLLEAARDLGASSWQSFIRISLPLISPGIIAGCVMVFVPTMGSFYLADMLGGAKLLLVGNVIKTQFLVTRDWPFGSALSLLLLGLLLLMLSVYWLVNRWIGREGGLNDPNF